MKGGLLWLDTYVMSDDYAWLLDYNFVIEGVLIIPREDWPSLYESEWNEINSAIKGML